MRERCTGALIGVALVGAIYGLARLSGYGWLVAVMAALAFGWLLGGYVRRLSRMAERDPLTGVSNRRPFERVLQQEWERSVRTGDPMSLLFIDIDDFGAVNKKHGHLMGDEVLKGIVRQVKHSVRRYDVVARWGGEEFVVLLPEIDMSSAVAIAERIRGIIEQMVIRDSDKAITVTVSMGVSTQPGSARSARELLRHAVAAQQKAKARKNAVSIVS